MLLAVTVFLVTGSVMAACIVGYLPVQVMIVVGVIFTAAFVLLVPIVLGPLAWLVAAVLYPLLRTEGRIAHRQVLRRRVRTTLTIGILYIAVSTAISLGTNILDNVNDIHTWLDKTLKGDFFIRLMNQDVATGQAAENARIAGQRSSRHRRRGQRRFAPATSPAPSTSPSGEDGKQPVIVCVRDFTDKGNLPLDIKDGDPAEVRQRLAEGEVVLGTVLAHRIGVKVGDEITLETREGPKQLRVAATATAYHRRRHGGLHGRPDRPAPAERRRRRHVRRQHGPRALAERRGQAQAALRRATA